MKKTSVRILMLIALSLTLTGCEDDCNLWDDFLDAAFGGPFTSQYRPPPPPPDAPLPPEPAPPVADCTSRDSKGKPQCPGIVP